MKQYVEIVIFGEDYDLCVTFDGTKLNRFGDDAALLLFVAQAIEKVLPEDDDNSVKNSLSVSSAIFGLVDSAVRRRYAGQDVMLYKVRFVNRITGHAGICER